MPLEKLLENRTALMYPECGEETPHRRALHFYL